MYTYKEKYMTRTSFISFMEYKKMKREKQWIKDLNIISLYSDVFYHDMSYMRDNWTYKWDICVDSNYPISFFQCIYCKVNLLNYSIDHLHEYGFLVNI